ncbi:MAG TPA: ABC transporter permease [Candidatus Acidoferrales bacterium]|nr:ABC transporter permease [Candidatus Acidoferrales bacterium]
MRALTGDIRYAFRLVRKAKIWALAVSATLALGIGACTAMFAVGNAVLFRPLPYAEPERLVALWGSNPARGVDQTRATMADFADWRARTRLFEDIGYSFLWPGSRSIVVRTPAPRAVNSAMVSSAWVRAFGVSPERGRLFAVEEDRKGASLAAMISDGFWAEQYGRDPSAIGRVLTVDSFAVRSYRIVGVMPPGLILPAGTDVWLSLGAAQFEPPAPGAGQRCCEWLEVIGRLRGGVTVDQARRELNDLQATILAEHGPADVNPAVAVVPMARQLTRGVRQGILMLMAAVACVLLIACVNAANLLLARSGIRAREMAIRSALGATRGRLVRQLLVEAVILAAGGGAAGLWLGSAALRALKAIAPDVPRLSGAQADGTFVGICAAVAVGTGILFGLAPALAWAGSAFVHGQAAMGGPGRGLRSALVISEVAVCTVLLAGAALLLRSLGRLDAVDPGFRSEGVLTARVEMTAAAYSTSAAPGPNRPQLAFRRIIDHLRTIPGVISAGGANRLPLAGIVEGQGEAVAVEGRTDGLQRGDTRAVTPEYFDTMGMRLLRGRGFTEADTDQSKAVVIVNESAARRYWPGQDPIGRRMAPVNTRFPVPVPRWTEVVGVVADVRHARLDAASRPQYYEPYLRGEWRSPYLVVRVQGDPAQFAGALRRAVAAADGSAVTTEVRTMETLVAASSAPLRFRARLLAAFALLALLLAAAGIYGVMSCLVEQRTAEIGVRMALGADSHHIFSMVLGRGMLLSGTGLAIGMGGALLLERVIAGLLFETSALDPVALSTVGLVLLASTLAACWAPSRRASQVEPASALRAVA